MTFAVGDVVTRRQYTGKRNKLTIYLGEVIRVYSDDGDRTRFDVQWAEKDGLPITPWMGIGYLESALKPLRTDPVPHPKETDG